MLTFYCGLRPLFTCDEVENFAEPCAYMLRLAKKPNAAKPRAFEFKLRLARALYLELNIRILTLFSIFFHNIIAIPNGNAHVKTVCKNASTIDIPVVVSLNILVKITIHATSTTNIITV